MNTLRGRHFVSLMDYTREELVSIFSLATRLKAELKANHPHRLLEGKTLAMIFEKPSTRTRISFETGIYQLGGTGLYLSRNDLQLGRGETIPDTARVLSRYVDCIMARTYAHKTITDLATYSSVPVINGLTDYLHPCQALTDYFTMQEEFGPIAGRKLCYLGDGSNNMVHSLLVGAAIFGVSISIGPPEKYRPAEEILAWTRKHGAETGARVEIVHDATAAVKDADVLYTDVWMSMGQEEDREAKFALLQPFQINAALLSKAAPKAIVLHCLPAHRGEELASEVMDGPQSRVFDQAENRLHVQKALMVKLLAE